MVGLGPYKESLGCIFTFGMRIYARFLFARPLVVAGLLSAVLPFLVLMGFAQPAIDDYDNAAMVARLGYGGAQWYWYTHWSGRFVAIGLSTLLNPLSYGPRQGIAPEGLWALRGILLLLLLALVGVVQQVLKALLLVFSAPEIGFTRGAVWALTLAVIALSLNALPEPYTLLFWYSGAMNYVLPLVFTLGFAAAALRALHLPLGAAGRQGWAAAATASLLGAVGGGEVAMLCCGMLLAGLGAWLWAADAEPQPGAQRLWAVWVGVGIIAAGFLAGAPGNWQRLSMADPDAAPRYHRWVLLVPRTLLTAARMAARPPVLGAALVLAAGVLLTAAGQRRRPTRQELALVLGGYAVLNCVGVAFLKAFFMRDIWVEAMPGRVVNVLVLQLLFSTTALSLWAREWIPIAPAWLRARVARPALAALAVVLLVTGQARRAWVELLFTAPAYAVQMQARYQTLATISRTGGAEAVVPPLLLPSAMGVLAPIPSGRQRADVNVELHLDAAQKNNLFLAHYYGIPRVRLSEPPPTQRP